MTESDVPDETRRILRASLFACIALAVAGVVLLTALGRAQTGLALAVGLLIGAANGRWANSLLRSEIGFRTSSVVRLAVLSAAGIAVGLVIGASVAWVVILGVAVAQLTLAAVAVRELVVR